MSVFLYVQYLFVTKNECVIIAGEIFETEYFDNHYHAFVVNNMLGYQSYELYRYNGKKFVISKII
uniref:Uncharacterized protein n=1 Tax=Strigamia maritima TaxID=126957 RepID=T1IH54_STRMM